MYIQRNIDKELVTWGNPASRKPLLIRGARQVGKSSSVREYAKKFDFFIEINFEIDETIRSLFEQENSIKDLCSSISILKNIAIIPGKTLLFLDEIQMCPKAITKLRYFYEQYPELHVIAAGSLLEFALQDLPSFGVGRIRSLFVYPLSFNEFLSAIGENLLLDAKINATILKPLANPLHEKLIDYLKKFMLIGGMPEVVADYAQNKDLLKCKTILYDLMNSLQADFGKYSRKVPSLRIREVFESVVQQMGGKFKYSKAAIESNNRQVKEALQLLILAGLVIPVTHSSANGIPLGAESNPQKQKMLLLDTGIFQLLNNLDLTDLIISKELNVVNKGNIAELFVGLELLKSTSPLIPLSLFYWEREKIGANAEVDYLLQKNAEIIPLEVKSGTSGSMQSIHQFIKEKNSRIGIRASLENFNQFDQIKVIPLYSVSEIHEIEL